MLFYRFVNKNLIARPHRLMAPVVFFVALVSFLYNPHSPFYSFSLAGPGDYMRMNEAINWLQWQGWYDFSHPRLNPGARTVIHLSRLLDMPLALIMKPFLQNWGYRNSATLAALSEPLILLGFLLALISAMARPLVGRGNARLAVLFVPFTPMLFAYFTPGHVAQRNWEILIAGVGLMALPPMLLCRKGWKAGILAAVAFAFGLLIGPEIVPCLTLCLLCLVLISAWQGGFALRNAAVFGVVFMAVAAALLPADVLMFNWPQLTGAWFSSGYVLFSALFAALFVVSWLFGKQTDNKFLRLALGIALFGFAATALVYFVPDIPDSVFADYGYSIGLDKIHEAQPLIWTLGSADKIELPQIALSCVEYVLPAILGLIICGLIVFMNRGRARILGLIYGLCLGGTLLLALFLQSRFLCFVQVFQIAPLVYATRNIWGALGKGWNGQRRFWVSVMVFALLGPLPGYAVPAIAGLLADSSEMVSSCSPKAAAEYIGGPWGYVTRPYTILSGIDEGPELLFRTPHNVLGANFDIAANQDILAFFEARDEKKPLDIIRQHHVDLLLICRNSLSLYANKSFAGAQGSPSFAQKLVNGPVPGWLESVEIPTGSDYLLFEVHLPETKAKPPVAKK